MDAVPYSSSLCESSKQSSLLITDNNMKKFAIERKRDFVLSTFIHIGTITHTQNSNV